MSQSAQPSTSQRRSAQHYTALRSSAQHCIELHSTAQNCAVQRREHIMKSDGHRPHYPRTVSPPRAILRLCAANTASAGTGVAHAPRTTHAVGASVRARNTAESTANANPAVRSRYTSAGLWGARRITGTRTYWFASESRSENRASTTAARTRPRIETVTTPPVSQVTPARSRSPHNATQTRDVTGESGTICSLGVIPGKYGSG